MSVVDSGGTKIVINRDEIERLDMEPCKQVFKTILQNPFSFYENVEIFVRGYEYDERELFEIPEVKCFIREIDKFFPYWTFFINKNTSCLRWITYCLMDNVVFYRQISKVQLDGQEMGNLLIKFFNAQNQLFNVLNLSDEQNDELSDRVVQYFEGN